MFFQLLCRIGKIQFLPKPFLQLLHEQRMFLKMQIRRQRLHFLSLPIDRMTKILILVLLFPMFLACADLLFLFRSQLLLLTRQRIRLLPHFLMETLLLLHHTQLIAVFQIGSLCLQQL